MRGIPFNSFRDHISIYVSGEEFINCVHVMESGSTIPPDLDPYSSRVICVYKRNGDEVDIIAWIYNGEYYDNPEPIFQTLKQQKRKDEQKKIKRETFHLDYRNGSLTMDRIESRIRWIVGSNKEEMEFNYDNYCCMVLLLSIGHWHPQFQTIQLIKEREWFLNGIINYCGDDDRLALQMIRESPLKKMTPNIDATTADLLDYQQKHPEEWFPPEFWYSVSFKDLPAFFLKTKILYEGGMIHIQRKELGYYWWRQLSKKKQNIKMTEQIMFIMERITDIYKKQYKQDSEGSLVVDIEDMPPCLQKIAKAKRFPGDQDRQTLVRCLARGGVSLHTTEKMLEDLNTKYPHNHGPMDLKKRWDYVRHFKNSAQRKKGYAPPNCESDSLKNLCPFREDSLDQRKMKCHQECFKKRHPEKFDEKQASRFWGPKDWFKFLNPQLKTEERGF